MTELPSHSTKVTAVSRAPEHELRKPTVGRILLSDLGVEGDAHLGQATAAYEPPARRARIKKPVGR